MKSQRITAVLVASMVALALAPEVQAKKSRGGSVAHSGQSQMSNQGFKSNFGQSQSQFRSFKQSAPKFKSPMKFNSGFQANRLKTSPFQNMKKFAITKKFGSNAISKNVNKYKPFTTKVGKLNSLNKMTKINPTIKKFNSKHVKALGNTQLKKYVNKHASGKITLQHNFKHAKNFHFKHKSHDHHWRHFKPYQCWWWYNWCRPLHTYDPIRYSYCDWNYVRCDYIVGGATIVQDARWYLGVKGMILPGKGLGIEKVATGSPADLAGLKPGLVIQQANGVDLVDEAALATAIKLSNGVLSMVLVSEADGQTQQVTVQMTRLLVVSY